MTNDQIIELANKAGITFVTKSGVASATEEWIVNFAQLLRNEVLEEAAEACERLSLKSAKACAEVIRLEKS